MTEDGPLADAMLAARLTAIEPRLGGIVLRGGGAMGDVVIDALRDGLAQDAPMRRVPIHVDDERLLGGIDLSASLAAGRAVRRAGLLAEATGGIVVLPMAERIEPSVAARIAGAVDSGAGFVTVALDDGVVDDEHIPPALAERLAFPIDLSLARDPSIDAAGEKPLEDMEVIDAIVRTSIALGIGSARAPWFALLAARALAQHADRSVVTAADVACAARLVLGPRATRIPAPEEGAPPPPSTPDQPEDAPPSDAGEAPPLDDIVLAAALATVPRDVLAALANGASSGKSAGHGAGAKRRGAMQGRRVGVRAGIPRGGPRLALIDTLRAAAPWQRIRGRCDARLRIRRDDLRVYRRETRAETLTIFAVDASGSAALARLAEAKGAVELLLAEAYVKRAEVALIAFRGDNAELLLPPTRSLTRARRALADLPGGGGTPLAAGLIAARRLAEGAIARGRTPFIVVLTDGRANVALDQGGDAAVDADAAARTIAALGVGGVFIDISARPRTEGATLAAAMRARYMPLPRADAAAMTAAIRDTRGP